MAKVEKIQDKVKYKAFGKTKPMTSRKVDIKDKEINAPDEKQAKEILKEQTDRMEAEITKIKAMNQGRPAKVFKMREIDTGKRKSKQEAHAIKDDETSELVVSNEGIKKISLKYCLNVFKNNEPDEAFKEFKELKEKVHILRMEDKHEEEDVDISEEEFFCVLCSFEAKKSPMYNFIINTGLRFRLAILKLCKKFIRKEEFPKCFDITTLIQIPKKGSQLYLENSRFIHMKHWLPRLVEALTVSKMKEDILKASSKFQIGGQKRTKNGDRSSSIWKLKKRL